MVENPTIEDAVLALYKANLDYASTENGIGYNKLDSHFGNSLGEQIDRGRTLSMAQAKAAYKMVRKYKVQLHTRFGIDYDLIPAPETEEHRVKKQAAKDAPKRRVMALKAGADTPTVTISSEYNQALVDEIKALPERRWDTDAKVWEAPLTVSNIPALLELAQRNLFVIEQDALDIIETRQQRFELNVEASSALDAELEIDGLGGELMPFQRAGVRFALDNLDEGGVMIADEMGLGKTVQALAVLQARQAFPALVAVPKVVWLNWAKETRKWLPGLKVVLLASKTAPKRLDKTAPAPVIRFGQPLPDEFHIAVINYDILTMWQEELEQLPWQAVVYDEAHLLKERKAKRTKAAMVLSKIAKTKLLLTGTPVPNRPAELITQLNLLNRLDVFGGFRRFWYWHCEGQADGARDLEGLNMKMRAAFYVRRNKLDVLPELPPIQWDDVPVDLSDPDAYEKVEADLFHWFKQRVQEDEDFKALLELEEDEDAKAQLIRERAQEATYKAKGAEALVQINALRQTAARLKLDSVKAWVESFLDSTRTNGTGNKIILFTHHRVIGEALSQAFDAPFIVGGMDAQLKAEYEERFQTDPHTRVIVCAIEAAGLGITLTAASDVAFVELPWRPMDLDQAAARAYGRVNDPHGVNAYQLVASGTIEEKILELIDKKRRRVTVATDGGLPVSEEDSVFGELLKSIWEEVGS
jgi:SNF2 family DNA or RNA helicase